MIADARDMREKLAAQFPGTNRWDLKYAPGGLVDIEFIAQTLQLCAAPRGAGRARHQHHRGAGEACRAAISGRGRRADADRRGALQQALTQVLRIALDGTLDPQSATPGLKALLVRAGGAGRIFANWRAPGRGADPQTRRDLRALADGAIRFSGGKP